MKRPDKATLAVRILERLAGRRLKYFDVACPKFAVKFSSPPFVLECL
jgi:hypothetical protein